MAPCPVFPAKMQHRTQEDALEHQKRLVFRDAATEQSGKSRRLSVFQCPHCGSWHVGHEEAAPLVWHYTCCQFLDAIVDSGELKPPPPRALIPRKDREKYGLVRGSVPLSKSFVKRYRDFVPAFVDVPVPNTAAHIRVPGMLVELERFLWFSRNPHWEHSVDNPTRIELEVRGLGLLRFGVPARLAPLRWPDYLDRNHTPPLVRDVRTQRGDPTEWLGTDRPVSLDEVRKIQVYMRTWMPLEDVDGDAFEAYLESRGQEYAAAAETLEKKLDTVPDALLPRSVLPAEERPSARSHDDLQRYCTALSRHIHMTEAERIVLEELWYHCEDSISVRSTKWRTVRPAKKARRRK